MLRHRIPTLIGALALATGCPSDDDGNTDDPTSSTTASGTSSSGSATGDSSTSENADTSSGNAVDSTDTGMAESGSGSSSSGGGASGCGMPVELAVFDGAGLQLDGFHVVDDRLVAAVRGDGLALFDVADPSAVTLLGSIDPDGGPTYRAAQQGSLLVGGRRGGGAFMVDATDPANMTELWVDPDLDTEDIVFDDHLYLASSAGLSIVDVADPATPVVLVEDLQQDGTGQNIGGQTLAKSDDVVFMAGFSFTSVDIEVPAMPTTLADLDDTGRPDNLVLGDGHLYVGGADGVQIFDVSDPAVPTLVGTYPGERATLLALDPTNERLFVFGSSTTSTDIPLLRIVDVTDKANPVELGAMYDELDDPLWAQYDAGRLYFTVDSTDPPSLYVLDGCSGG